MCFCFMSLQYMCFIQRPLQWPLGFKLLSFHIGLIDYPTESSSALIITVTYRFFFPLEKKTSYFNKVFIWKPVQRLENKRKGREVALVLTISFSPGQRIIFDEFQTSEMRRHSSVTNKTTSLACTWIQRHICIQKKKH